MEQEHGKARGTSPGLQILQNRKLAINFSTHRHCPKQSQLTFVYLVAAAYRSPSAHQQTMHVAWRNLV